MQHKLRIGVATIGNEVVKGRTLDTNFNYIADFFTRKGKIVEFHVSCRDDTESIGKAIDFLKENCDVIITTGGLGPTMDDITIQSIAKHLGKKLIMNTEAESELRLKYKALKLDFTPERMKMAVFPEGAELIQNHVGSAPGMILKVGNNTIFSLPGVPSEMKGMLDEVHKRIGSEDGSYLSREFKIEGVMESSLAPIVRAVYEKLNNDIYIKTHPLSSPNHVSQLLLEIYGYDEDKDALERRINETYKELRQNIKIIFNKDI